MLESIWLDVRHGARVAAKQAMGTAAVLLSIAIAIGASTTVYTWTRAIVFDPLPAVDEDGLVDVTTRHPTDGVSGISFPELEAYRGASTLAGMAGFDDMAVAMGNGEAPERRFAMLVSAGYFELLGIRAFAGRMLGPDDDRERRRVAVISHRLWQERFGGAASVLGETIALNRESFTVVGVAPPGFAGTIPRQRLDLWVPLRARAVLTHGEDGLDRHEPWLSAIARLRGGASLSQASQELAAASQHLREAEYPADGRTAELFPLWRSPRHGGKVLVPLLAVIWAVAALVLAIACSNIAGVLVARAASRRREIAIRLTLGARRIRLVRQLLTESVLMAAAGGALGLPLALLGSRLLARFIPPTNDPIALAATLDGSALAFGVGLSALAGILFGLAPAFTTTSVSVNQTLKAEAGSVVAGSSRLRAALLVGQVALSALLLFIGAALGRSVSAAGSIDPGFDTGGVLIGSVDLAGTGLDEARGGAALARLVERAGQVPGVEVASLARRAPLGLGGRSTVRGFRVDGHAASPGDPPWAHRNEVGPRYFAALGLPLVAGRDFLASDDRKAAKVAIVNQTMAERYWRGGAAVGGRISVGGGELTVVGVVADADFSQLGGAPAPWLFVPLLQSYRPEVTFLLRGKGDPTALAGGLRRAVADVDPGIALFGVRTLDDHIGAAQFPQRLMGSLAGGLGAFALILAAVGVYAVTAQNVAQRRREMGIRMALGATPGRVFRRVLGRAAVLVAIGLGIGLVASPFLQALLAPFLVGVGVADPLALVGVSAVVVAVCLLASAVPAGRAARLEPLAALRDE